MRDRYKDRDRERHRLKEKQRGNRDSKKKYVPIGDKDTEKRRNRDMTPISHTYVRSYLHVVRCCVSSILREVTYSAPQHFRRPDRKRVEARGERHAVTHL